MLCTAQRSLCIVGSFHPFFPDSAQDLLRKRGWRIVHQAGWIILFLSASRRSSVFRPMCSRDGVEVAGMEVSLLQQKILQRIWEKVSKFTRGSVLCVGNRTGALFGVFRQVSECGEQRLAWGPKCHSTARDPGDRFSNTNPNLFKNIVKVKVNIIHRRSSSARTTSRAQSILCWLFGFSTPLNSSEGCPTWSTS